MSLLSGLIVQGARSGVSRGASQALGQAVGSALGSGAYPGLSAGGGASSASQQAAVDRLRSQMGMTDAPPAPPTEVSPVNVGAAPPPIAPSSAISQALANAVQGVDVTGRQAPAPSAALADALTAAAPTDLDTLTVTGTRPPPPVSVDPGAFAPPITGALTTIGQPEITPPMEPVTEDAKEPLTAEQIAMLAPFAALGLVPTGTAIGEITPTTGGDGKGLIGGLDPKQLIAAGLLGAGLLNQGGSGGATGDLKDIAQFQRETAGRLANIAEAGFQGKLGGNALNAIQRMVRKAQAAIRQRYASMGLTNSTAEQDDLNDAVEAGVQQQFEIGQKMATAGLNAVAALTGQSAQAYLALLNASTAKDTALGNALANFAGAIAR